MNDMFEIGKVAGAHGLKGELKVFPYTDDPAKLLQNKTFYCGSRRMDVLTGKMSGKFIVLGIKGIDTPEEAESMRGQVILMDRSNAAPLAEGVFYIADIIGCQVYEGDSLIGKVDDVMRTGSNDVYSVIDDKGVEILIPVLKSVIRKIDTKRGRIDVILPEGLVDGIEV